MDDSRKKEEFSYGYIKIIAAVSGLEVSIAGRPSDNAGIDIIIKAPGIIQGVFSPRIDAQVKCTSGDILKDEFIKYPLPVNNYKRLAGFSSVPQILIVVIVPKKINTWLSITENETVLKSCAYWISLTGEKATKNKNSITIDIPRQNLLTPEVLGVLIEKEARRQSKIYSLERLILEEEDETQ